ncbi:MAG: hypothetical protein U0Y68_15710 [Blastocatellia bacterium]
MTSLTIEVFQHGQRLAVHSRSERKGRHTTLPEHLPKAHQAHLNGRSHASCTGGEIGPATQEIVQYLLEHRAHPEMGYRPVWGCSDWPNALPRPAWKLPVKEPSSLGRSPGAVSLLFWPRDLTRNPYRNHHPTALPAHENLRGASYYQ